MSEQNHAGFAIASCLNKNGVNKIFTLCGGHISPILVGCEKLDIEIIQVRDEATTVFAADAVSRITDSVGVAVVTAGPGVTNTVTAVKNAQMAQSPLVLFGGAAATLLKGKGSLQDIDQLSLFKKYVKKAVSVKKVRDIVPVVQNALNEAKSGVPGPIFIELPIDLLYPEEDIRKEFSNKLSKNGFFNKIKYWYVNKYLNDLFSKKSSSVAILENKNFSLNQKKIDQAALKIVKAKKPVFICGNQVTQNKEYLSMFRKSLKKLQVPTFTSGMARGCFNNKHDFFYRHNRRHALKNADVIVALGVPLDFRLNYGFSFNHEAEYVAINKSKNDLILNKKPDLSILGDPAVIMHEIGKIINAPNCNEWKNELKDLNTKREKEILNDSSIVYDKVNPIYLCKKINELKSNESVIIADGGDFVGTASYVINPNHPLEWLDPGPFGTLGVGGGFAIGAKSSFPHKEVWILYGDGASAYSLAEFDTMCRHNLPVIAIVGNDASWQQIAREQKSMLGSNIGTKLEFTSYEKVVEGYGGVGYFIDNQNDIETIIKAAKKDAANGLPVLINVHLSKTDFRKGSISV